MKQIFKVKEKIGIIKSPADLFNKIEKFDIDYGQENVIIFYLNTANGIIKSEILFKGGIDSSILDVRLVLKNALLNNATRIIVAHNHPSNNLTPSRDDEGVLKHLKAACDIIEIKLLDFIIFNKDEFISIINK